MVLAVETARNIKLNKKEVEKIQRQKEKEREKSLIKDVRALGKDSEFMSLKTQRAMAAYALENIEDLDPSVLKKEIQVLHDKW